MARIEYQWNPSLNVFANDGSAYTSRRGWTDWETLAVLLVPDDRFITTSAKRETLSVRSGRESRDLPVATGSYMF
jgi:hypothetical protein